MSPSATSTLTRTEADPVPADGADRGRSAKSETRRIELAESALVTLGELGYARTSLREIAQNSKFSHGVVHYYFASKAELITFCVRHYKETCVTRYDDEVARTMAPDELLEEFVRSLTGTMVEDAPMHRLWYDVRVQAMFEESLQETILDVDQLMEDMVGAVLARYAQLAGKRLVVPVSVAYPMIDGLFESHLLRQDFGDERAPERFAAAVRAMLPTLFCDG